LQEQISACTLRFLPLARLVFDDSTSKLSS
jgi:hypothetical protein